MMRWPRLVALLGSVIGLAVMLGGFACYLSASASATAASQANVVRMELYAAVFIGALVFATSAIAFCKMHGTLDVKATAHPGHGVVNVSAMLLCGWLGYAFVTEHAQPFGLAALLAMSVLAAALGTHLMISREYSKVRDSHAHAFAGHCDRLVFERRGLLARIEWHGGEEQAWALRDKTPGTVRAAAYRHRRGWHNTGNMGAQTRGSIRQRSSYRAICPSKMNLPTRRAANRANGGTFPADTLNRRSPRIRCSRWPSCSESSGQETRRRTPCEDGRETAQCRP